MRGYYRNSFFALALEELLNIKNRKSLISYSKKLIKYVLDSNDPLLAFRLALELDFLNIQTTKLQNLIINSGDARYILKFAREIKKVDIKKLQTAIVKYGNILQIAKFGCFVRGAQRKPIEELITKSDSAKSAYIFLRFVKFANVNNLKSIILRSKRPRYLFLLAKKTKNKKELEQIQNLIINSSSLMYVRLFAVHIKNADIKKLEDRIISSKNVVEMKRFARAVKDSRLNKLSILF